MKYITSLCLAALLLAGCKSPEDTLYKTTGTVVITADAAMSAWLDYKNTHAVPQATIAKVKAGYEDYYAALMVEKVAVVSYKSGNTNALALAIVTVQNSQASIISLITQLLPAPNVAKLKGL